MRVTVDSHGFAAVAFALASLLATLNSPVWAQDSSTIPAAEAPKPTVQHIEKHVARGVDLIQEITPAEAVGGPLLITVIRVDPKVPGVRVEAALGQDRVWNTDPTFGREAVSRLVARHKAVAGVNAGFFPFAGNPLGLHVGAGDMVTEPTKQHRTSFYITKEGLTGFARFQYGGTARVVGADGPNATHRIDSMNRKPGGEKDAAGELLLFTPIWSPKTLASTGRVEVLLGDVTVPPLLPNQDYVGTVISQTVGGETPIAAGSVVLSGTGPGADFLRTAQKGAQISFRMGLAVDESPHAPDPQDLREVVTGGPRILTDGVVTNEYEHEGFDRSFSTTGHPRSAIGRTADGVLLLVTVDGRQKGLSKGAPLPDLAAILQRFGAVDGLNLDGGGSSTAVVWDGVANSPSEGIERPVADALLVYGDDLPEVARLGVPPALASPDRPLQVGETWDFAKTVVPSDRAVWGVMGGIGFVSQAGLFHALRPGKGTVLLTMGSRARTSRATITVVGVSKSDAAGFAPKLALLPADGSNPLRQILTIHIANAEGDPLGAEPVAFEVRGGNPEMTTVTTDVHGDAQVAILWSGPIAMSAPRTVKVISPRRRFAAGSLTVADKSP